MMMPGDIVPVVVGTRLYASVAAPTDYFVTQYSFEPEHRLNIALVLSGPIKTTNIEPETLLMVFIAGRVLFMEDEDTPKKTRNLTFTADVYYAGPIW